MLGQKDVLKQVDALIANGFPRFLIVTGAKGQGKTELIIEISKKLEMPFCNFGIKIDEIRELIDMAYKQTEPIIYVINNADKMSMGAKNSLLKLIEEPPNNAYIVMELQSMSNTLETIKSRCIELKMQEYTDIEINKMMNSINPDMSAIERAIIEDICSNYYQIKILNEYGIEDFYNYVEKVVHNIYRVQSANSFKIAEKLDLKDDENGYNLRLFFITFRVICFEKAQLLLDIEDEKENFNSYIQSCNITAKYMNKLNINGINKQSLIDMWILGIRKIWRSE